MNTPTNCEHYDERTEKIKQLNDLLRKLGAGGRIFITRGMQELDEARKKEAIQAVRNFNNFTPDNDPYGQHDFGKITLQDGTDIFWKIDYYDKSLQYGSNDPTDPKKTTRVLTIMLADEY